MTPSANPAEDPGANLDANPVKDPIRDPGSNPACQPEERSAVQLVITTLPDRTAAMAMARTLVDERLAACVSLLGEATSIYRWQGAVETAQEVPLLIKTTTTRWPALRDRIAALHPYEVPEILALPVTDGLPAYLAWACSQVSLDADG